MSTYPEVQLVDAATASATVLFDFNDITLTAKREVIADGFSLGVPELEGDVDAVDPLYGPRTITFPWRVTGTKASALAAQSALARRVMAGKSWLRVRLHSTGDILFFRTYRLTPGELSLDEIYSTSTTKTESWTVDVTIPCEPFAYGERQTMAAFVINNDPTAAVFPQRYTLGTVLGDAPTPLRVAVSPNNRTSVTGGRRWMVSNHSSTATRLPVLWQIGTGDGFSAGTDTGSGTAGASYTGGSYRIVTFAGTATMDSRLQGAPAAVIPGRYKVLLRMARSDTASTFAVRFQQTSSTYITFPSGPAGPTAYFDQPTTAAGFAMWLDLGDHQIPYGVDSPDGVSSATVSPIFDISMSRLSGAGSAYLDAILLVPIDLTDTIEPARFMFAQTANTTGLGETAGYDVIDGEAESHWKWDAAMTAVLPIGPFDLEGQFPRVVPGVANVLTLLMQVDNPNGGDGDKIGTGATTDVTVSYQPRWLWLGDS